MQLALAIAQILNVAAPGIAELILMIKKPDGTISIISLLDQADAQFDTNIKAAKDWLAAHPAPKS